MCVGGALPAKTSILLIDMMEDTVKVFLKKGVEAGDTTSTKIKASKNLSG